MFYSQEYWPWGKESSLLLPLPNQEEAPKATFETFVAVRLFVCGGLYLYCRRCTYTLDARSRLPNLAGRSRSVHPKKRLHGSRLPPQSNNATCQKYYPCTTMNFICTNLLLFHSLFLHPTYAPDPVLRQYTELPYPDFSEAQLNMERIHYANEDRQVGSTDVRMSFFIFWKHLILMTITGSYGGPLDVLWRLQKHLILMLIAGSYGGQSSHHIGEPQPLSVQRQGTLSVRIQGIRIDNDCFKYALR